MKSINGMQRTIWRASQTLLAGAFSLYLIPAAYGAEWTPSPALAKCEQAAAVTAGQRPTKEQWQQIKPCMESAWQSAWEQCAQQNGITLPSAGSGQQLAKDDWKKQNQCMKAAGFKRWHGHHGHHPHHWGNDSGASGQ